MEIPKISVIVTVYKTPEEFLRRCIESITRQSYKNLEILLIDDGSNDSCSKIIDEYAHIDKRIICSHQQNAGVSSARNNGLHIATGQFIFFCDSDDFISEKCIEILYKEIKKNNTDMVKSSCHHFYGQKEIIDVDYAKSNIVKKEQGLKNLYYSKPVFDELEVTSVWGCLFKSNIAKSIQFDNIKIGEDLIYMMNYISESSCVEYISNKLYYYRIHEKSVMNQKYNESIYDSVVSIINKIESENKKNNYGIVARLVNTLITIYIRLERGNFEIESAIRECIEKYRYFIIKDKNNKNKLRVSLFLTYLIGFRGVRWIYVCYDKYSKKEII